MIPASILVVEDERIVAQQLRLLLESLGYAVPAVVSSGAKALEAIARFRPNLVLMDIHIEGPIDGIDVAARLPADGNIEVIFVTGSAGDDTLRRARSAKPHGFLMKPYSEGELHATVQSALERQSLLRQLKAAQRDLVSAPLAAAGAEAGR